MELVVRYMPLPIYTENHVGYIQTGFDFFEEICGEFSCCLLFHGLTMVTEPNFSSLQSRNGF